MIMMSFHMAQNNKTSSTDEKRCSPGILSHSGFVGGITSEGLAWAGHYTTTDRGVLKVVELLYFSLLCVVFMFAYGVAAQSLLYPQSEDNWWDILYRIFYHPYLSMFQEFPALDELQGLPFTYCDAQVVILYYGGYLNGTIQATSFGLF